MSSGNRIVKYRRAEVNCFGGSDGTITVQAQGGSGALHYQWNDPNGQTNAMAVNLS
ncbi:MAG: SprB repeat-containing protein [Lewinellaceae bacterium]|nr:SprB repeat-containing protein [Lewinellaceae bacterium]